MANAPYQHLFNFSLCAKDAEDSDRRLDSLHNEFCGDTSNWHHSSDSRRKRRPPDLILKVAKPSLWTHSRNTPSWDREELLKRRLCSEPINFNAADAPAPSLVWACFKNKDLQTGASIHDELRKRGLVDKQYSDPLIAMYARCGLLQQAEDLLDTYGSRNVVSWTALIAAYAREGKGLEALSILRRMQLEGVYPNEVTYSCILKACAAIGAIDEGKKIHDEISRNGLLKRHVVLGGALVDMYAKCGALNQAQNAFEELPFRNTVIWNALISGYIQKGKHLQALHCFERMQNEGFAPDEVTYACILKACASIKFIEMGKKTHQEISRQGLLEDHVVLGNALVDMYAKCGAFLQARSVLEKLPCRDVVSWNALITGFAQNGQGQQALDCLAEMEGEDIHPNEVTYVSILKACAAIGAIDTGMSIHDKILRQGLLENHIILGGALVDMYVRCGALALAQSVSKKLPVRNIVSWNALIMGFAQNGLLREAMSCLEQLQDEGIPPDEVTYTCIFNACAASKAIDVGKEIHKDILRQGLLERHILLGNALVDMYAKCGMLLQAHSVLEELPFRDVVSWNALMAGYIQNGQAQKALDCYKQMQYEDVLADEVTYGSILKACAMVEATDIGEKIHKEILRQGLLEHHAVLHAALVDMYVKCGALCQAHGVLEKFPSSNAASWNALITGYVKNGQGQQAFDCFKQMQHHDILPDDVTFRCLLNLCCHLGLVEKGQEILDSMEASYGMRPDLEIYSYIINLLGRTGNLVKAAEIIERMPLSVNSRIWHCFLHACRKWTDVNLGTWAFDQAIKLDKYDGAAYVLMANVYSAAGMFEKAKDIESMRIRNKVLKLHVCYDGIQTVESIKV